MRLKLIDEIYIGSHYLNYLVNAESEGLTYDEKLNIDMFILEQKQLHKCKTYIHYEYDNLSFKKCKFSDLYSNCAIMQIFEVIS